MMSWSPCGAGSRLEKEGTDSAESSVDLQTSGWSLAPVN